VGKHWMRLIAVAIVSVSLAYYANGLPWRKGQIG
jgi:hypothetical protein